MTWRIEQADCIEVMAAMDEASVDAICTDPPYGIGFMGKEWDAPTIVRAAAEDAATRKSLGPESPTRPGRAQPRSSSAFGSAAHYAGPVRAGREWQAWCATWATEALRILKPGGHLLAFGGTRTYHRLACAVEDAGFEIRDSLIWLYGSGFPKSLDVSKAIDKAAGAKREVVGQRTDGRYAHGFSDEAKRALGSDHADEQGMSGEMGQITAPATPEAQRWQGWGTALKPSHEPIVVARKPLAGTVAANVTEHGTGALNIDGTRIGSESTERVRTTDDFGLVNDDGWEPTPGVNGSPAGRWPPNVVLSHLPLCVQWRCHECGWRGDDSIALEGYFECPRCGPADVSHVRTCAPGCPVAELDRQSGERKAGGNLSGNEPTADGFSGVVHGDGKDRGGWDGYGDTGGASRFFYTAKASRAERNAGLDGFEERLTGVWGGGDPDNLSDGKRITQAKANVHPTVKPIDLMRWLVRLVTPPGGTVLDPFAGSGTTGCAAVLEGFDFIGIEREAEYAAIAEARIGFWAQFPGADVNAVLVSDEKARAIEATGQGSLLEAA